MNITAILLAGGVGSRMQTKTPKQFLELNGKPILSYSLNVFLDSPEVAEIIIVAPEEYRSTISSLTLRKLKFANPGVRRQDSLFNALEQVSKETDLVCIHDAARPFITPLLLKEVLEAGRLHKAATVAVPVKFTIKEALKDLFVKSTLDRSKLWEIQTPQVLRLDLLKQGFTLANEQGITVTDDVSLAEIGGHPVKLVEGSFSNIKITTQEDLALAEQLLRSFI